MLRLFKLPSFSHLDKIKQWKKLIPRRTLGEITDPMSLPVSFNNPATFQLVIKDIEEKQSFNINQDSMALYSYTLGRFNLKSSYINKEIEKGYEAFKGKLSPRSAFAFFYGCLALNMTKPVVYFAREEYEKYQNKDENFIYRGFKRN